MRVGEHITNEGSQEMGPLTVYGRVNRLHVDAHGRLVRVEVFNSPAPLSAWLAPAFVNGWSQYGGGYDPASYRQDALTGQVFLRGAVKGGSGTTIWTLPVGFRRTGSALYTVWGESSSAYGLSLVAILADGSVGHVLGPSTAFLSLDGISFFVD